MKIDLEKEGFFLISELDWNFDAVPESELAACCLWEYARESKSFAMSSAREAEMSAEFGRARKFRRTPDPDYEAFLHGYWNSDEGYMQFYETIRVSGGPNASPWLVIPPQGRAVLKGQVGVHEISQPFAPVMYRQLEALWKANLARWKPHGEEPGYDADDDTTSYEASHPHIEEPGHAGETHGDTIAAFAIDFRKFSDKQIKDAFSTWLREHRPKKSPGPSQRGRKHNDLRVALDRLGMMRLLHRFTLAEMPKLCPSAAKAFAGYEWYKERKRAGVTFRKLFGFLPKGEQPLSWATKGGRSK